MNENHMTRSLEDYLEAIYNLEKINGSARVTDLAREMNVSKPSANQALITLSGMGFVQYEKYEPVTLTEQGALRAQEILRLHTLLRCFLIEALGVDGKIAERDACKMEHVISRETIEGIMKYMKDKDLS